MANSGELTQKIPEFSASQSIKIAPGTSVPVTDRILRIIDSKVFQRLRKIRQLSLSDQVFPSATHTRFSHALGVYGNILDYLQHLDSFESFRSRYTQEDYYAVMLAGLLHDLGHYPCSHQLDHLPSFPKHEDLTIALILGEMRIEGDNLGQMISQEFDLDPKRITRLLGPSAGLSESQKLMKQLIDSPIDADKCDYLPRDSYHCGLDYGTGFDRERFIASLFPNGDHLCILEKGLMSAERFQLARYWMYRSVYWGHTVRALITMLSKACQYINEPEPDHNWPEKLMTFNDHNFLEWLHGRSSQPGRELLEMIHFRRQPFKRLFTFSYHHQPETYERLRDHHLRDAITDEVRSWAAHKGLKLKDYYLLWDVPPLYKTSKWESFPIRLSSGEEAPVAVESPVIDALGTAFLHGVRKIRLFCHPDLADLWARHPKDHPNIQSFFEPNQ